MELLNRIEGWIISVNGIVWGIGTILLLMGTHLFMTIRTGGIQRYLWKGIRLSVAKEPGAEGEVSQMGALATALAATIGTGNIIGEGTAIALGGPGAVFWCWLTGVLGIATKYSEALIAVKFRVKTRDGRMQGGAMYALARGLHMPGLALLFAFSGAAASFGIGCAVQVNAIAAVCNENQGLPPEPIGVLVGGLTALVIFGGVRSVAAVCEKLVPFMAGFYLIGNLLILCMNRDVLAEALCVIVEMAFQPGAAAGGLAGGGMMQAMRYGIARGLFSNESGMGSAPIAAAAARTRNPVRQALVSMTGTFWDTVVLCALTGLVLVSSIMKNPAIDLADIPDGGVLTSLSFAQLPVIGPGVLIVGIIAFAFSTILGWSYYGERCVEYLAGGRALIPYRMLYVAVTATAPVLPLDLVWMAADIFNALMAIPNLTAVICLSPLIAAETKKYIHSLDRADPTPVPCADCGSVRQRRTSESCRK